MTRALALSVLAFSPVAALAQTFDMAGECSGPWTLDGVDLGSAVFELDPRPGLRLYTIDPVVLRTNEGSFLLRRMGVFNDSASGLSGTPFDGVYLSDATNRFGVALESSNLSLFSDTSVPTTLTLADFDQNATIVVNYAFCGSVSSITATGAANLADVVDAMRTLADASYTSLNNGATATLEDSGTLVTAFGDALDDLTAAGCNVDPDTTAVHIGAAYGSAGLLGSDENGELTGEVLDRPTQTFGATLSDGSTSFGTPQFSVYARNRLYADQSDGGFVFGLYKRTRGARGTAYALSASCPGPIDPLVVLDGWLDGM